MKKAMIAMSGGVDSSVAAHLMKEEGYDCIGATMHLFHKSDTDTDDVADAKAVATRLGMDFHVLDYSKQFQCQVVDHFVASYEKGETPNPCIECNRHLKFGEMVTAAKELGCDVLVTGHYARIVYEDGRYQLKKALDPAKDQSYVLYSIKREQLASVRFPLGEYTKDEVREIASQHGFVNAKKQDSQDICFVPDGDYASVIEQKTGHSYQEGDFVTLDGTVLGTHKGIIHYTIGQRKGLGLSLPESMYVCKKDVAANQVVLCKNEELFHTTLDAYDCNWLAFHPADSDAPTSFRAKAKIRYRHREEWATITITGLDTMRVVFDEPQRAITPGQAVVIYQDDEVIGGGTIL